MSRSLMFRLETKMPWHQTLSRNKKAVVFRNVRRTLIRVRLNAGDLKVCEIFDVRGI